MCSKHYNGRIGQLVSTKHILVAVDFFQPPFFNIIIWTHQESLRYLHSFIYMSHFFIFFYTLIPKIFFSSFLLFSSFTDIMVIMIRIRGILLRCTGFGQRTQQALLRVQWKGSNKIWVPQGALLKNLDWALPTVLKVNRVTSQLKPVILVTWRGHIIWLYSTSKTFLYRCEALYIEPARLLCISVYMWPHN